jgi:hypothetical protein
MNMNKSNNSNANANANAKSAATGKKVGGGGCGTSVKQGNIGLSSKNSTECTYCHEFGHSASEQYCPAMKAAAFFVYEAEKNAKKSTVVGGGGGAKRPKQVGGGGGGRGGGGVSAAAVPKTVSKFAALSMGDSDSDSDSDSDTDSSTDSSSENVVESVVDEFPVLGMAVGGGGGGGGGGMSYRAAIMKSSKPAAVATVTEGGMTSLKLSGFMKRVRFEDIVSSSMVVFTLPLPPPLVEVNKPWKLNRFVSDWNASSSDDDSDCD